MKRLLIKLGWHGVQHERARIKRELHAEALAARVEYMFWQGEYGWELNSWRMK